MEIINSFHGQYDFLSNFYPCIIQFEGLNYPTVEHAYQAGKSTEFFYRKLIAALPAEKAGLAKRRGRDIRLRRDWETLKVEIMFELLCTKFKQEPLKSKLLSTGNTKLVEGNRWHDNIWGNCICGKEGCLQEGQNWLGRLLMDVRGQLREKNYCHGRHS